MLFMQEDGKLGSNGFDLAVDELYRFFVRIEPTVRDQGLIAECPRCVYVTSVLLKPLRRGGPD